MCYTLLDASILWHKIDLRKGMSVVITLIPYALVRIKGPKKPHPNQHPAHTGCICHC